MNDPGILPVSFTKLKHMGRSPAHFLNNLSRPFVATRAMRVGTVTDSILFNARKFAVWADRRAGKAWEAFEAETLAAGCDTIVNAAEHEQAAAIASALKGSAVAAPFLAGERNAEIKWELCGLPCLSHPDVIGSDFVTDLKTTQSSKPSWFTAQAIRMGYHAQLAFYMAALAHCGQKKSSAYIVAAESSAPYAVTVLRLTDRALEAGERLFRIWIEQLKVCIESAAWPAYTDAIVDLDVLDDTELMFAGDDDAEVIS